MSQFRILQKQGGSTVVTIPPYMLQELCLEAGDQVEIWTALGSCIYIKRRDPAPPNPGHWSR
jgi:antitoxin component of MazEF toxin-antitoxin module